MIVFRQVQRCLIDSGIFCCSFTYMRVFFFSAFYCCYLWHCIVYTYKNICIFHPFTLWSKSLIIIMHLLYHTAYNIHNTGNIWFFFKFLWQVVCLLFNRFTRRHNTFSLMGFFFLSVMYAGVCTAGWLLANELIYKNSFKPNERWKKIKNTTNIIIELIDRFFCFVVYRKKQTNSSERYSRR